MDQKYISTAKAAFRLYERVASALTYAVIYGLIFVVLTMLAFIPIAAVFGDELFHGHTYWRVWTAFGVASLPALGVFYLQWRRARWRRNNPNAWAAKEAEKEATKLAKTAARQAAFEAARNAPPSPATKAFIGFLDLIFNFLKYGLYVVLLVAVPYIAYQIIIAMPVNVAIIVGAVIIGICILAATNGR